MNIYKKDDIPEDLQQYFEPAELGLEETPEEYVQKLVEIFREVRRVLRDDGVAWIVLGDSYVANKTGSTGSRSRLEGGKKTQKQAGKRPDKKVAGLKPKDLVGIPWRVAFALQQDGWWLRSDIIWCLSGGTKVYAKTQKGEMPMTIKDMVRLDPSTVKLWNGEKWTQVLGYKETKRPGNPIKIVLRSGERIGCTPEHEWPTQRGLVKAEDLCIGDIIKKTDLPEPENYKQPSALDDKQTGWLVGMYLAEGSRDSRGRIQIASNTKEANRKEKLEKISRAFHGSSRWYKLEGQKATARLHGTILESIIDTYVSGNGAKNKHLSVKCWERSNKFLKAVLMGYLEGDGHYDKNNDRWRLGFTRNYNLEDDLRTLCARVGCQLRLKPNVSNIGNKEYPSFRGEIRFDVSNHQNTREDTEIVGIERSRARKFWDIAVEDEPHLFALASGVLTHNSKGNPMPESVTDRPTKSHEYIFLLSKSNKYYYDNEAIKEESVSNHPSGNGFKRPQQISRNGRGSEEQWEPTAKRNKRTVWNVNTKPFPEAHFAVYPMELIEPCILAGSKKGDIVLDPFMGAGTTALAAQQNGRDYVGIELNDEYIEITERRLQEKAG